MSDQTVTENKLTHFDEAGNARMVDVGGKSETVREATASGAISLSAQAFQLVREGNIAKGDVLGVARLAGIMAAKKVDALIPLAHPLVINKVTVDFDLNEATHTIGITATVGITGRTGVEMEALTAVSVAALTIYDMCKAVDKGMIINNIRLERKIGGKSGNFQRNG
ncbi:MAG: cyclic pyranopterin monophosphate synthase MoaC [Deltaproteobacteria bacterium]|nr:cyclic pyranopterin monophosphate synthase MoaC [Deltaproteobacteria bacterium]